MIGQGQDTLASAHEVNFDQAGVGTEDLLLLREVLGLPGAAGFIRRTQKLNDSDHTPTFRLAYLQTALRYLACQNLENFRLGQGHAAFAQRYWFGRGAVHLDHTNVRHHAPSRAEFCFDEYPLFNPGQQVGRQAPLKRLTGVNHQAGMHIPQCISR